MDASTNSTLAYQQYQQHQLKLALGKCYPKEANYPTSYGYVPGLGVGIAYCVLFGVSMLVHTVQLCWKRTWWCSVFSIGCLGKDLSKRISKPTQLTDWGNSGINRLGWSNVVLPMPIQLECIPDANLHTHHR